jgi:hypothetical protein
MKMDFDEACRNGPGKQTFPEIPSEHLGEQRDNIEAHYA